MFKGQPTGMLPHDDDVIRLAGNAMHFAESFQRYELPARRLERKVILRVLPPEGDGLAGTEQSRDRGGWGWTSSR